MPRDDALEQPRRGEAATARDCPARERGRRDRRSCCEVPSPDDDLSGTSESGYLRGVEDKRQHPRKSVDLPATIRRANGETVAARIVDLSFGGLFAETTGAFAFGDEVTLVFSLPGVGDAEIPATIRWTKPTGVGAQFGLLGARHTHALGEALKPPVSG